DGEGAAVEQFCVAGAALLTVEQCQVVEGNSGVGVFGAAHFLPDGEGAAEERFGVAVAALPPVELRQVVEASGGAGVFGAEHFLRDGESAAVERFGVAVLCPFSEVGGSVVQYVQ